MGVSFLHWGMLAAAAVGAVPIIIHLLAKGKPDSVPFPPLVLLRKSFQATVRRSRIRHLLLLVCRVMLLVFIALALARPLVRGGSFAAVGKGVICAVLVIDDSMSMQYLEAGKTRFDRVRGAALEVVDSVAVGSQLAVYPSSTPRGQLSPDLDHVRRMIDQCKPTAGTSSLWTAVRNSADMLTKTGRGEQGIIVFTDMTAAAWRGTEGSALPPRIKLSVLSVAHGPCENLGLSGFAMPAGAPVKGGILPVEALVTSTGVSGTHSVGFYVDGVKMGQSLVALAPGDVQNVRFSTTELEEGVHWGKLALSEADALPLDNERYFCFRVLPSMRVLIVGQHGSDPAPFFVSSALDPFGGETAAPFSVEKCGPEVLDAQDLEPFDLVYLVNVPRLTADAWRKLLRFCRRGGGLIAILGDSIEMEDYSGRLAAELLPAIPRQIVRAAEPLHLRAEQRAHPLVLPFQDGRNGNIYGPAFYACVSADVTPEASTVFSFDGKYPALVERAVNGRILMLLSGLSRSWTDLPRADPFPCFPPLMHEMARYVSGRHAPKPRDFIVGSVVPFRLDAQLMRQGVFVTPPDSPDRAAVVQHSKSAEHVFVATDRPGLYDVQRRDGSPLAGLRFAVNTPEVESDLRVLSAEQLRGMFPGRSVSVSRSVSELREKITDTRVGREVTWLMLALVAGLFLVEHYLATRFYGSSGDSEETEGTAEAPQPAE